MKPVDDPAKRLAWVDTARGIGIALVVVGHVDRGLMSAQLADPAGALQELDRWIYAFHMPLFFVLSGLFAERRVAQKFSSFFVLQLRTIAWPYLVWSALQTAVQVVLSGSTNRGAAWSDLLDIPVAPPMQFWFLYALFVVAVAYKSLRAALPKPYLVLLVACALFAVQPLLLGQVWSVIATALVFLSHFSLGAVVQARAASVAATAKALPLLGASLLLFVGMTAIVQRVVDAPMNTPLGAAVACLGVAATFGIAMVASRTSRLSWLQVWGRASLPIFVAHTLASAGTRIVLLKLGVRDLTIHVALGTLTGMAGPLFLNWLVERYRIPYVFSWPGRRAAASP